MGKMEQNDQKSKKEQTEKKWMYDKRLGQQETN